MALCNLSGKTKLASAIEGPRYKVVRSESDFEVRLYDESSWMSASVRGSSFNLSTASGFHSGNADYTVRFYISPKYKGNPPQPNPELKLHLDKWNSHCVAVRKFSGFAGDNNIDEEVKALVSSINKRWPPENSAAIQDKGSYSIAQYNGSDTASGRLNEAWINISGAIVGGCPPSQ
ncbi:uncharacterized protein LOC114713955 isoform X2 [Neltuma alba]|uniref:uncharacterized protein LOC114713955 isoform X2 n=1 Tax=Neltuma alba TaxID=207710 RepID=UPI0010A2D5C0|nr:uncharacterized protein LOC114713955 isoform X2 [Prosopis alba]